MKKHPVPIPSRVHVNHILSKIQNRSIFSEVKDHDIVFKGAIQDYIAQNLIHNSDMTNLSFFCKGHQDRLSYEVTSLHFDNLDSRNEMIEFLKNIQMIRSAPLKKCVEYITEDLEGSRFKLIIVDKFSTSVNIKTLILSSSVYHNLEKVIKMPHLRYGLILSIWQTIKELRSLGIKNMGISSSLVYLVENITPEALLDKFKRYSNFFEEPEIRIEYKFNQFRNLLIADAKNDMTMQDLTQMNFLTESYLKKFSNKTDSILDHNTFIVLMIEIAICKPHENFVDLIDFERGQLSQKLKSVIGDRLLIGVINDCFMDRDFENKNFFTQEYDKLQNLYEFFKMDDPDSIKFDSIDNSSFKVATRVVPIRFILKFIASVDVEDLSRDQVRLMAEEYGCGFLLAEALKLVKNYETDIYTCLLVVQRVIFFFVIVFENPRESVMSLDCREMKKFIVFAMHLYSQNYDKLIEDDTKKFIQFLSLVFKRLTNTNYEILSKNCDLEYFDFFLENAVYLESYNAPIQYLRKFLRTDTLVKLKKIEMVLRFFKINAVNFNENQKTKIFNYLSDHKNMIAKRHYKKDARIALFYLIYARNLVKLSHSTGTCIVRTLEESIRTYLLDDDEVEFEEGMMNHISHHRYYCKKCNVYLCHTCYIKRHKDHDVEYLGPGYLTCDERGDFESQGDYEDSFMTQKKYGSVFTDFSIHPKAEHKTAFSIINRGKRNKLKKRFRLNYDDKSECYRIEDAIFKKGMKDISMEESMVAKIGFKVISGGMDNDIQVGLMLNPKTSRLGGIAVPGRTQDSVGYNLKTGMLTVVMDGKERIQLPRAGSGDVIEFWFSSYSNVYLLLNGFMLYKFEEEFENTNIYSSFSLNGFGTELEVNRTLEFTPFLNSRKDGVQWPQPDKTCIDDPRMALELVDLVYEKNPTFKRYLLSDLDQNLDCEENNNESGDDPIPIFSIPDTINNARISVKVDSDMNSARKLTKPNEREKATNLTDNKKKAKLKLHSRGNSEYKSEAGEYMSLTYQSRHYNTSNNASHRIESAGQNGGEDENKLEKGERLKNLAEGQSKGIDPVEDVTFMEEPVTTIQGKPMLKQNIKPKKKVCLFCFKC